MQLSSLMITCDISFPLNNLRAQYQKRVAKINSARKQLFADDKSFSIFKHPIPKAGG